MHESGQPFLLVMLHRPRESLCTVPWNCAGRMSSTSPLCTCSITSAGQFEGPIRGRVESQRCAASASASVALLAHERCSPRAGGGGRREVSGTAASQSWRGFSCGGGPGGGA
jgi:hypothetical protein